MTRRVLAGIILLGTIIASHKTANAASVPSTFNVQAQTACEAETLDRIDAREVFSGKAYDVLKKVARAYGRPVPHIYIFPGDWNMAYIAASTAVDGRGKIVVGQQAIDLFNNIALKGFLGHEMAHLVSDSAAEGCNDYVIRDPQMEADADALAAQTLGRRPVKAFLERVLALTERQNLDAKHRIELLQRFQLTKSSGISTTSLSPLSPGGHFECYRDLSSIIQGVGFSDRFHRARIAEHSFTDSCRRATPSSLTRSGNVPAMTGWPVTG